ncbi:hypothetical protein R1sor_006508 [Riccia sorocarpa]|uniref:Reverse transcriptase zinc-binding domain-containing protein n=1 Tax=Riccia sorocarpa TaxID=122646 RepID=A0ABD3HQL9_9MARC
MILKDGGPPPQTPIALTHAAAAFTIDNGKLIPSHLRNLPMAAVWKLVPLVTVWCAQKKPPDRHILDWKDKAILMAELQWKDHLGFLSAPNAIIRRLVSLDTSAIHRRLQKWAIPTNTWRHPQLDRRQEDTWCVCCAARTAEDIPHLFWGCEAVLELWSWAVQVLHIAFPITRIWAPSFSHAVLGEEIPHAFKTAAQWWERWRLSILWIIWVQRNEKSFSNTPISLPKAKAVAWFRLLTHTRAKWKRHCKRADTLDLTLARRDELDTKLRKNLAIDTLKITIRGLILAGSWRPP